MNNNKLLDELEAKIDKLPRLESSTYVDVTTILNIIDGMRQALNEEEG